jgi:hypothetical protein
VSLTASDIIEAIIDDLVMGEVTGDIPEVRVNRDGDSSLTLDYGDARRFVLTVRPA